jgi:deleted-in-malignant-brain-tumors protein 1
MEGRLQIYHGGAWGEVCDDYFDGYYPAYLGYSTTTVCQQLGYRDGTFLTTYDAPNTNFFLDDVNCTGTERRLGDCPHLAWGSHNCGTSEGAGFSCQLYAAGDARLMDGAGRNSGRVEILHNNVWGTICDDGISSAGTNQTNFIGVTCAELGFSAAGTALVTTACPDGLDPVWMDDVVCSGGEPGLASCPFSGWGIENCSHFEDIGLTCTP